MSGVFEIHRDASGKIYFELKAASGQTLLTGRGYSVVCDAEKAAESARRNGGIAERYRPVVSSNGEERLMLTAVNGAPLAVSQAGVGAHVVEDLCRRVSEATEKAEVIDKRPRRSRSRSCAA